MKKGYYKSLSANIDYVVEYTFDSEYPYRVHCIQTKDNYFLNDRQAKNFENNNKFVCSSETIYCLGVNALNTQ